MRDGKIVLTNPVSVEEDSNNCSRFSVGREHIYYR
jgi:hypothetical protein